MISNALRLGVRAAGATAKRASGALVRPMSSLSEPAYLSRPYKEIPSSIGDTKGSARTALELSCYYRVRGDRSWVWGSAGQQAGSRLANGGRLA